MDKGLASLCIGMDHRSETAFYENKLGMTAGEPGYINNVSNYGLSS